MTLGELSKQLTSQGFHLIQVESLPDEDCLSFVGTFDEYLSAAKALGSRIFFVSVSSISEDDFIYINSDHVYSPQTRAAATWPFPTPGIKSHMANPDRDTEEEDVDLCSINPALNKYKKRIGEDGRFDFLCADGHHSLTFSIIEKWMEDFEKLHSEAEGLLDEKFDAEREQMVEEESLVQAEASAKRQVAIQKLQDLASDRKFISLNTQREMLIYAESKIPELKEFDERELKREIAEIKAKIKVKKLDD